MRNEWEETRNVTKRITCFSDLFATYKDEKFVEFLKERQFYQKLIDVKIKIIDNVDMGIFDKYGVIKESMFGSYIKKQIPIDVLIKEIKNNYSECKIKNIEKFCDDVLGGKNIEQIYDMDDYSVTCLNDKLDNLSYGNMTKEEKVMLVNGILSDLYMFHRDNITEIDREIYELADKQYLEFFIRKCREKKKLKDFYCIISSLPLDIFKEFLTDDEIILLNIMKKDIIDENDMKKWISFNLSLADIENIAMTDEAQKIMDNHRAQNECSYIFQKGTNKGEKCGAEGTIDPKNKGEIRCSRHSKSKKKE